MLYERSRLCSSAQFTYLDQITDGPNSTIRDGSPFVAAFLLAGNFVVTVLADRLTI